jgi:prophage antirepressor-like protein
MNDNVILWEKDNMKIRTIQYEDGNIGVNAEDTAKGFGFTQIKNGIEYIKWERINEYLNSLGFSPLVGKDDFIPESMFYLLGMKANNKKAQEFQKWLAIEVIPDIRKGNYVKITEEEKLLLEIAKEKDVAKQTILVSKYGELQYDKGREIGYKQAFEEIKNERLTPLCEITYIVNKIKEKIKGFSSPMLHQFLITRGLGSLELINRNYRFKPNKNFEKCIIENGWASYTNQSKTAYKFYESWADFIIENLDYYSKDLLEAKDKVYEMLKEKREEKKIEELPF